MSSVTVDREGEIAFLKLTKPPVNAVDLQLLREAEASMGALEADDAVRAIIVTGDGPCFCAGLDLKVVPFYSPEDQKELMDITNRVITGVYGASKPIIAAVNGHAVAGGFILMMSCDYRVGAEGSYQMGVSEVRVGIPFPISTMEVLKSELTPAMARRLILTGRPIGPREALEGEVLDELVAPERLIPRALEKASELGALSTLVYNRVKTQLRGDTIRRIRQVLETGDPLFKMWQQDRSVEGAAGFLERKD
ncbi:MAG: enoyl-CoA hydratase/isomerase family protein [Actinobacteria bacterium]|nr:enoyl-CoA hydratase/isomerase family protein [Actinomycetota bacterium]MBU1942544.1 enoyl-CoA hydratase/isomerase family protein [Actinomycetota bacterium]MBU2687211.1 enoyl-CoA hydratase/isomerase family protein [Actinomycetota bacterium]